MKSFSPRLPPSAKGREESRALHRARERRATWIDAKSIRERMEMSQVMFARLFGISTATLRHWEAGERRPSGPALALLQVIARHPRAVIQSLKAGEFKDRELARWMPDPVTQRIPAPGQPKVELEDD